MAKDYRKGRVVETPATHTLHVDFTARSDEEAKFIAWLMREAIAEEYDFISDRVHDAFGPEEEGTVLYASWGWTVSGTDSDNGFLDWAEQLGGEEVSETV